MKNITTSIKGTILTITVDLSKDYGMSSSGKSKIIASSEGNVTIGDNGVKLGLNIYTSTK